MTREPDRAAPSSGTATRTTSGYVELVGSNRDFRRLITGQVISQTGDWFNSVALFTLLLGLTGSGEAIAYVLILKLLPTFFIGPIAGVVADRYDRKTIMIAADILRGVLVLGFLLVRRPDQIWIAYALTGLEVAISTFFDPAKSATIPNIVALDQLVPANTLSGASWSVTLAVGAALGGVVTGAFGRNSAFVIDSLSFFLSALFISGVRVPRARHRVQDTAIAPRPEKPAYSSEKSSARRISVTRAFGIRDFAEGAHYIKSNPSVLGLLLVKTGWGMGGGVLLLLTVYGNHVFPLGQDGSVSIGLLYAARGLGAVIGPVIAHRIGGGSTAAMQRAIGVAFFVTAMFYLLIAHAPALAVACLFVTGAHAGGSIQWVFSTTLLQIAVPDRYLGRIFALDMALLTLTMSLSTYLTGWALDHAHLDVRTITSILGAVFLAPGIGWFAHLRFLNRTEAAA
ncbi:MAG TPA: MFS transporter [Blastocatellia bacterium]|nr:MFS transporter [Blastocatellia bacterium]